MSGSVPARIVPPERALPPLRLLRTVVDNPIKAWPRAIYRERIVRSRVLGRDTVYVMAPDLIRQMLADETDNFEKGEIARRGLGPVLGDAILTADGSRWRWQRHAAASIFRQERIRSFLPAMVAAAERTRDRWISYPPGVEIDVAREMMRTTSALHRHEAYWPRPDEFDPGRFKREIARERDRYTYLPFGAGPRVCIGQTFALWEATAILATLLNSIRLRLRPGYIPEPKLRVTLRPAGGMPMQIATVSRYENRARAD